MSAPRYFVDENDISHYKAYKFIPGSDTIKIWRETDKLIIDSADGSSIETLEEFTEVNETYYVEVVKVIMANTLCGDRLPVPAPPHG